MTAEDIVFLLGYQEIGSFLRAFTAWTGRTIHAYRNTEARKIYIHKKPGIARFFSVQAEKVFVRKAENCAAASCNFIAAMA